MRRRRLLASLATIAVGFSLAAHALGEVAQRGDIRVTFSGSFSPRKLPRSGRGAIAVSLGGKISSTDGTDPPGLGRIEIAINRVGHLDPTALPTCRLEQIQPASTAYARQVCGRARVGEGSFSAAVSIPEQAPYPSRGVVTAFNGREAGHPVVFLHIYGTEPLPTSFTLPLSVSRGSGTFGTILRGKLPSVDAHVGFVTGITLKLNSVTRRGRSYLSASCPAPRGFSGVVFPLARASFAFAGGAILAETLVRHCRAR
ncbi:MAG TPA: hypothetical protein VFL77_12795 [Solirubrobacterales bacterium]|nr:hypothetical protein [Solirubrobacterales bacterium]